MYLYRPFLEINKEIAELKLDNGELLEIHMSAALHRSTFHFKILENSTLRFFDSFSSASRLVHMPQTDLLSIITLFQNA